MSRSILRSLLLMLPGFRACRQLLLQYHANTTEIRKPKSYGSWGPALYTPRSFFSFVRLQRLHSVIIGVMGRKHSNPTTMAPGRTAAPRPGVPLPATGVFLMVIGRPFGPGVLSRLPLLSPLSLSPRTPCLSYSFKLEPSLPSCLPPARIKLHRVPSRSDRQRRLPC